MTTVEIKRVNGECKSCKAFHSYEVASVQSFQTRDGRFIDCVAAMLPSGPEYIGMTMFDARNVQHSILCGCGKRVRIGAVQPKPGKATHKCGASCRGARSTECNCECGGAHHGSHARPR